MLSNLLEQFGNFNFNLIARSAKKHSSLFS